MKFPDLPRAGFPIAQTIKQIIGYLRSSRVVSINGVKGKESPNGTTFNIPVGAASVKGRDTLPPLMPRLIVDNSESPPIYKFTLTDGMINERLPGTGDAFFANEIMDIRWGDDAALPIVEGDIKETEIEVNQQISVIAYVDVYGELGGTLAPEGYVAKVVAEDEDVESTHYIPICGDDRDGTEGEYHYKIAVLRPADETHSGPWLELYLAGSHLDHFRELPQIDNFQTDSQDDYGRPVSKYDPDTNQYLFRASKARFGTIITEEEELFNFDFLGENIGDGEEVLKLPDTEEDEPLPNEPAKFRTIRGLNYTELEAIGSDPAAAQQIRVSTADGEGSDEGASDTILVQGNGARAALIIRDSYESELGRITWDDGLVTDEGDVTITIESPAGSGGNLNLEVSEYQEDVDGILTWTSYSKVLYWRNGLFIGEVDPADSPVDLITQPVSSILVYLP